ncbi:MAG: hypothetical protein AAF519_07965 [Bacteroidota bacterium]
MPKKTFSFCLFLAFSLTVCSGVLFKVNAQESEFLFEDDLAPTREKPVEHFIPDTPYTEDEKDKKEEKTEVKNEILDEETPEQKEPVQENNLEASPLFIPIESNSTLTDQDNPLSFNFLYYIIQKFKFSDVIDQ